MDLKIELNELLKYLDFPLKVEKGSLQTDFEMHGHNFNELVLIVSGTASHQVNDETYAISAGDVFVLGNGAVHGFNQTKDLIFYNVAYDSSQMALHASELKQMHGFQALFALDRLYSPEDAFKSRMKLSKSQLTEIEQVLEKMADEYSNGAESFRTLLQAHFTSLVVLLCRYYEQSGNAANPLVNRVAASVVHIEKNFTQPISVRQLSVMANMSERHFNRVFSSAFGTTPMKYIISLRMSKARSLLKKTDLSITEISSTCGFSDSNHFSKTFKREFGLSPKQIRR